MPAITDVPMLKEFQAGLEDMKDLSAEERPLMLDWIKYQLAQIHQSPVVGTELHQLYIIKQLTGARNDLASLGVDVQEMTRFIADEIELLDQLYPQDYRGQYQWSAVNLGCLPGKSMDKSTTPEPTAPTEDFVSPEVFYATRSLISYEDSTLELSLLPPYNVRLLGVTFEYSGFKDIRAGSHSWLSYDNGTRRYTLCTPQSSIPERDRICFAARDVSNISHLGEQAGDALSLDLDWPDLTIVYLLFARNCEKREFVRRLRQEVEMF